MSTSPNGINIKKEIRLHVAGPTVFLYLFRQTLKTIANNLFILS